MAKKIVVRLLQILGLVSFFCGVICMIAHFDSAKLAGVLTVSALACSLILLGAAEAIKLIGRKAERTN